MYVYFVQPKEYVGTMVYKIGMSAGSDLSRLRSYGIGTEYICFFSVNNYLEVENAIIGAFGIEFDIDHGREYFKIRDKERAIELFTNVVNHVKTTTPVQHIDKTALNTNTVNNAKWLTTDQQMFSCNICEYTSQWKHHLTRHLKSTKHINNIRKKKEDAELEREQKKRFVCNKCGKRFPKQQNLTRHINRLKPCINIV